LRSVRDDALQPAVTGHWRLSPKADCHNLFRATDPQGNGGSATGATIRLALAKRSHGVDGR
jgi:hypothetical protein